MKSDILQTYQNSLKWKIQMLPSLMFIFPLADVPHNEFCHWRVDNYKFLIFFHLNMSGNVKRKMTSNTFILLLLVFACFSYASIVSI